MAEAESPLEVIDVARHLASAFDLQQHEYAFGGAIALGFWSAPRGTLDVDVTLFVDPDSPGSCIEALLDADCTVNTTDAMDMIAQHGFFRADYRGFRVDVFLPINEFYETARLRRQELPLEGQPVMVWDAESLAVFKMMFFREKDFVDLKQILRTQGSRFDREWVRLQLESIFGKRDPRVSRWDDITDEVAE